MNDGLGISDKVVVVTGGGSGIGKATCLKFAKCGATVVVADINTKQGDQVVEEIRGLGFRGFAEYVDVSDHLAVFKLIEKTVDQFGGLDIMINNAGIGNKKLLKTAEHTLEDWDEVIRVNQSGVFYCMKYALQHMVKNGSGNIVNVASLAGLKASGRTLAYSASKYAVVGMTKSAALEYSRNNIRINAVCPAYTESALLDRMLAIKEDISEKLLSFIPMNRFGKPEEIADAILWLASDHTSFITGQTITLDGGASL